MDSAAEAEVALTIARSVALGYSVSARLQYATAAPPTTATAAQPPAEPPGGGPPPFGRGPAFRPVHEAMRRGDYAEAERLLNEILRGNSGDSDAREFLEECQQVRALQAMAKTREFALKIPFPGQNARERLGYIKPGETAIRFDAPITNAAVQ